MQNVHFSPPEIAPLFEVNVSTVKRWIDRGLLKADITSGGHRRVSREQLMTFIQTLPIGARRSYVLRRLTQTGRDETEPERAFASYRSWLEKDQERARRLLERLVVQRWTMARIIDDVIAPTLRWIGDEWMAKRMSIYEEHQLSFRIRQHLLRLDDLLPRTKKQGVAVLACPAGEQHELPLQMLALVLRQIGWQPEILGINIPATEVARAVRHYQSRAIILSSTYRQAASASYLTAVESIARRSRAVLLFGGAGWPTAVRTSTQVRFFVRSAAELSDRVQGLVKGRQSA
ncbi:MAG: cobalamin B12-binding domain-containing protein [Candidatus Kerfeldbacteria bacterium]|nr:cobalamin B12-binding domain-containing protein [Candidatus Kerfeldbacteria bacterium]